MPVDDNSIEQRTNLIGMDLITLRVNLLLFCTLLLYFVAKVAYAEVEPYSCFSLEKAREIDNITALFDVTNNCFHQGRIENALAVSLLGKVIAERTAEKQDDQLAYLLIGSAFTYIGNYAEALRNFEQGLKLGSVGKQSTVAYLESNIADVFIRLNNYKQAIDYAQRATSRFGPSQREKVVTAWLTLSQAYLANGDITLARGTIDDCLRNYIVPTQKLETVYALQIDAQIYLAESNYSQAIEKANEALAYGKQHSMIMEAAKNLITRSKAEAASGNRRAAIQSAQEAVAVAAQQKDIESERLALMLVQQFYEEQQLWQKAYTVQQRMAQIVAQQFDEKLAHNIATQRVLNDVAQKEQSVERLQHENALAKRDKAIAETKLIVVVLSAIVLFALFSFVYFRIVHKRELRRMQELHDERLRLTHLKDQFLASTSHELRTPLNGIIGITDYLLNDPALQLSDVLVRELRVARSCGLQLSRLVDDILDYSQLHAGKPLCEIEETELRPIIEATVQRAEASASKKQLTLEHSIDASLHNVRGDRRRLQQVLNNLLTNAIKFTDSGTITLTARRQDNHAVISVSDSGIGIDEKYWQSIFEPFEQIDGSLKRRHDGIGLGLALAREIVRAHGSELVVESVKGKGSTFQFTLPLAETIKTYQKITT